MPEFQPKELICSIVIVRSLVGAKSHPNNKNSACNSETFRGNFKEFYPQQVLNWRMSKLCPFREELEVKLNLIPSSIPKAEVRARVRAVWNFTHAQIVILANSYTVMNVV